MTFQEKCAKATLKRNRVLGVTNMPTENEIIIRELKQLEIYKDHSVTEEQDSKRQR